MGLINDWKLWAFVGLIIVGLFYGELRYKKGYNQGEVLVQQERLNLYDTYFKETQRLEAESQRIADEYTEFREESELRLTDVNSILDRLQKRATNQSTSCGKGSATATGVDGASDDWIGGFAACATEYVDLGAYCAKSSDQLRSLQNWEKAR